jgi:hypothetical protein
MGCGCGLTLGPGAHQAPATAPGIRLDRASTPPLDLRACVRPSPPSAAPLASASVPPGGTRRVGSGTESAPAHTTGGSGMSASLEFFLGLLDQEDPVFVTAEDFDGALGEALRSAKALGFFGREAGVNPVPACPHCGEGVPRRLSGRHVCNGCYSVVDPRHLAAWLLDRGAFLRWLAEGLGLKGEVRRAAEGLWHLGASAGKGGPREWFYLRGGPLSEGGRARLDAYRNVLILYGLARPARAERLRRSASLLRVLRLEGGLAVTEPAALLRASGNVRFEGHSGALWVGDDWLGEVPPGSKEYYFLRCLAGRLDRFVPYADVKREVLGHTGGADETDEATFCHGLKSRIKKKWIPQIDLLVATTNKGDGYRLRGYAEL